MTKCALCDDEAKVTCDFCEKPFCQKHWSGHGHTVPYGEEINAATEEEKQSQINAIQKAHLKETETSYTQNRKDQAELREEEALAEEAEDERLEEEEKRKKKEYHPYEDPLFLVPVIGPLITAGKVLWQMLAGDEEEEEQ